MQNAHEATATVITTQRHWVVVPAQRRNGAWNSSTFLMDASTF